MTIIFRVDASNAIGIGHLRRCLSLATALDAIGESCKFLCARSDFDCRALIEAAHFEYQQIEPFVGDWNADVENVIYIEGSTATDWMVVDHYGLDSRWHDAIKRHFNCNIAVIDDLADRNLHCDLLLDQNYDGNVLQKYAGYVTGQYLGLFGPKFALLDPAYANADRYIFSEAVRSIGIFMGGTDPLNISNRVLDAIQLSGFDGSIEVATTSGNPALSQLRDRLAHSPNTLLTVDLPNLADFFSRHDLQIGAGGSATWERCCIGAPSILLPFAENHNVVLNTIEELQIASAMPWGWTNDSLAERILLAIENVGHRRLQHENGMALVGGHGATRVAISMLRERMKLRAAKPDDCARAYEWRNHPTIRHASHNSQPIKWEEHKAWFQKMLQSEQRQMFVATIGNLDIGHIRLDQDDDREEVSFYIDPKLNGLGIGTHMLAAVESHSRSGYIFGTVVSGNHVSHRLFEKNGYRQSGTNRWEKKLNKKHRNGTQ